MSCILKWKGKDFPSSTDKWIEGKKKKRIIVYNILFSASNREINTKHEIYFRKQQSFLHQIGKLTPNNKFILENNKSNVKNVKEIYICY